MKPRQGKSADTGEYLIERRARILAHFDWQHKTVLDYGAGNGAQTKAYAHLCQLVVPYDPNLNPKDWHDKPDNIVLQKILKTSLFDAVFSFCVLEHVENENTALQEIYNRLKPDGELIITVPNKWWIFEMHGAYLPKILPWNRVPFLSWLPLFIHSRIARARIYTKKSIVNLLKRNKFEPVKVAYITAPMDRVKNNKLQKRLRSRIFNPDLTANPLLATEIIIYARKK